MKRILFFVFAAFVCMAAATAQITVKGVVRGVKEGRLFMIVKAGEERMDTIGSCTFKRGKFTLHGRSFEPVVAHIMLEGYGGGFILLAEPGEEYEACLSNDESFYIKGGRLNDAYTAHMAQSDSLRAIIEGLQQRYKALLADSKFRSASLVNDTLKQQQQAWRTLTTAFLSAHDNLITAYTLYSNIIMRDAGLKETKAMYDSMGTGAKATHCARLIKERIERLEAVDTSSAAPDFTAPDLNGNAVTMSKVAAKVKIIDFWASWCGPCRMNNPALKSLYDEYRGKGLEIIGVSLDSNKEAWQAAVAKDGLNWINISSLKGGSCDIARKYSVTAIPALFVLDENNRIIASSLRGEKLKEFIKELLK